MFRVSADWLRLLGKAVDELSPVDINVSIGSAGHGGFTLPIICFEGSRTEFRRLAFGIVSAVHAQGQILRLPLQSPGKSQAISVWSYTEGVPKSFWYKRREKIKQHPWYPRSLKWDAFRALPRFCISPVPGGAEYSHRYLGIDPDDLHDVSVGGYPHALYRLARLLLDYANTDVPPEFGLRLEVEGGFRGVGPFSYEAAFEVI